MRISPLPIALMTVLFWVADAHIWGDDLRYHLEEPMVITLVIVAAALCRMPYVKKKGK